MEKNLSESSCYFITKNTDLTAVEKPLIDAYPPEKILIVYGTLAPNAPNHSVIEHIKGTWHKGIVRGKLEKEGWVLKRAIGVLSRRLKMSKKQ